MAQYTGTDELNGLFKVVYGDKGPIDLIPEVGELYKSVKLRNSEKIGANYQMSVIVANSHGFTYNTSSKTAFALNNHIAMTTQDATIPGTELVLRDAIGYRAAARSAGGKVQAFKDATDLVVKNMQDSHVKRLELMMWYGGQGIGATSSSANVDTTHTAITLTAASWASGIWSGLENAQVAFYKVADDTLVSSSTDAIFTVQKVNDSSNIITVTGTTTGISALDTAIAAGSCNFYFYSAHGEEMDGIHKILNASASQFGIDPSIYGLWKSNSYDCGSAQLTMAKVLKGVSKAFARGQVGKLSLYVSPLTWANLAADLSALRKYDGSYKRAKLENGTEGITFYAQNGEIEIIGYNIIKQGFAFALPLDHVHRVGSTDVTFDTPGMGGKIFTQLANNAGFELRNYSDTAIFVDAPARAVLFTGITNVA